MSIGSLSTLWYSSSSAGPHDRYKTSSSSGLPWQHNSLLTELTSDSSDVGFELTWVFAPGTHAPEVPVGRCDGDDDDGDDHDDDGDDHDDDGDGMRPFYLRPFYLPSLLPTGSR